MADDPEKRLIRPEDEAVFYVPRDEAAAFLRALEKHREGEAADPGDVLGKPDPEHLIAALELARDRLQTMDIEAVRAAMQEALDQFETLLVYRDYAAEAMSDTMLPVSELTQRLSNARNEVWDELGRLQIISLKPAGGLPGWMVGGRLVDLPEIVPDYPPADL